MKIGELALAAQTEVETQVGKRSCVWGSSQPRPSWPWLGSGMTGSSVDHRLLWVGTASSRGKEAVVGAARPPAATRGQLYLV
jgi:hypothetical protein